MRKIILTIFIVVIIGFGTGTGFCGDLDDDIEIDDKVTAYDEMGKPEKNINFIKLKAKMQAKMAQKQAEKGSKGGADSAKMQGGAMNSVVMGAGSNVRGDIIIIDESKGDKTQVVE